MQEIVGTLLYYSWAVDPTLACALSSIAAKQANGTTSVLDACHQLLDYVATYPCAAIRYHANKMILAAHSDASYLSEPDSKSHVGGHYFLTEQDSNAPNNGTILTLAAIIKHVVSSASEAELAALFYNCKNAVPLQQTLEEMGHHQPQTIVTTDNSTAHGLITNTMVPKASKAMDMRLNWLKCHQAQQQFNFQWKKGSANLADYHTKHHPIKHHKEIATHMYWTTLYLLNHTHVSFTCEGVFESDNMILIGSTCNIKHHVELDFTG